MNMRFSVKFCLAWLLSFVYAVAVHGQSTSLVIEDAQISLLSDVEISARTSGIVHSVAVKEGDHVEVGQLISQFDHELAQAEVDTAQCDIVAAQVESENDINRRYSQKTFEVSLRELERNEAANAKFRTSISATEIERLRLIVEQSKLSQEQAERDLEVARATVALKQATLRSAEIRLRHHNIQSPLSGMVVAVNAQPGEWVMQGAPMVRVIRLDVLRVEAFVNGTMHGLELLNRPVRFSLANAKIGPETYAGRVVFVSPEVHPVTDQIRIWAEIVNPALKLKPGMRGTLEVDMPASADSDE